MQSGESGMLRDATAGTKRGSEEMSSVAPNGNGADSEQSNYAETNDAKKAKLEAEASRVLHIRGIPQDVSDGELVRLGTQFGKVTNLIVMRNKNQAFLEMEDIKQATNLVTYHQLYPAQIREKAIYIQFSSNYKELRTDHVNPAVTAAATLQASGAGCQSLLAGDAEARTVLRVIVENLMYPVTIDVLKQIFSRYGQVLKIVIFTKNNQFQALVQFSDPISAQTAKVSLDGQNIYNGCCTLRLDFSKMTSLNIKYNNEKSRDYTNPHLPTGDGMSSHFDGPQPQGGMGLIQMGNLPGPMGNVGNMGNMGGMNMGLGMSQSMGMSGPGMHNQSGCVILVSNLNEEKVTPDALFTLFGVYGDVYRVKILYNKKDNALIQYAEGQQAHLAVTNLDKAKVWGKPIRVTPSKHSVVQLPSDQQAEGARLTKDYSNSPLHRYKKKGSKNYQNIYPPSATLHLSNIPPEVTAEMLQNEFSQFGQVIAFKFFEKDRKMALLQLGSVEDAITALIEMHNYEIGENKVHLKVGFSKFNI